MSMSGRNHANKSKPAASGAAATPADSGSGPSQVMSPSFERVEEFIKTLSIQELSRLNSIIVERWKFLDRQKKLESMGRFNVGDRVEFTPSVDQVTRTGYVMRLNTKTIHVRTIHGEDWKLSPEMLRLV